MVKVLRIPAPGTRFGPCLEVCLHRCCLLDRAKAEAACSLCGQPIGYEIPHQIVGPFQEAAHTDCLDRATQREIESEQPCHGVVTHH